MIELVEKIVSLISSIISLAAAIVAYKLAKDEKGDK